MQDVPVTGNGCQARNSRAPNLRLPLSLEELHGALVLLCGRARLEGAEVAALPRLRILLARVEPILTGFQLPDHFARLLSFRSPVSADWMISASTGIPRNS